MRIAVFAKSTTFHKEYGGLETQNKILCEGLVKSGHEVVVFSPKKDFHADSAVEQGVRYFFIRSNTRALYQNVAADSWKKKSLECFKIHHSEKKFDLVVSQSSAGVAVLKEKKTLGVKTVAVAHGSIISEIATRVNNVYSFKSLVWLAPDIGFALYNFFFRQRDFVNAADRVICVSDYVKRSLIEETYSLESKFKVVYNGVDTSKFKYLPKTGEGSLTKFLFVGQVTKEKGADNLLNIFKNIKDCYCRLDVIGSGDYFDKFKSRVKELNLDDVVFCHGKLDYSSVSKFYKDADVFLMPTNRIEGFPMVIVEAMLSGLPVISFNLGGVRDAIIDGETGFLVNAKDEKAFAEKMLELATNPEQRILMGEKGFDRASALFSIEKMLEDYQLVFKEILK